jgi:hypothetical protein
LGLKRLMYFHLFMGNKHPELLLTPVFLELFNIKNVILFNSQPMSFVNVTHQYVFFFIIVACFKIVIAFTID